MDSSRWTFSCLCLSELKALKSSIAFLDKKSSRWTDHRTSSGPVKLITEDCSFQPGLGSLEQTGKCRWELPKQAASAMNPSVPGVPALTHPVVLGSRRKRFLRG